MGRRRAYFPLSIGYSGYAETPPFGGHATLASGLVSYWRLNEESDGSGAVTRVDSYGTNHLTDTNTTKSAAGKSGNAALFENGTERLDYPSSSTFLLVGGATAAIWFNSRIDQTRTFFALDNDSTERRWQISTLVGPTIRFIAWDTTNTARIPGTPAYTIGAFNLLIVWYDPTDNKAHLSLNDVEAAASLALTGGPDTGAGALYLGRSALAGNGFDGTLDEAGFWSRALTAAERTALYNGGSGLFL